MGDRWRQDIPELFRLSYSTGSGSFVLDEVCQFLQVTLRALILPNLDTPDLTVGDQIDIAINVVNHKEVAGRKRTLGIRDLVFQITVQFDHERAERHGYDKFLNLASHWFIAVPRKHTPSVKPPKHTAAIKRVPLGFLGRHDGGRGRWRGPSVGSTTRVD